MPSLPICTPPAAEDNSQPRFAALAAICIAVLFALPAVADDTGFDCAAALSGSPEQQQQTAAELLDASYDTARLACAAKAIIAYADGHTSDYGAQLAALQANARYIYYLDRVILYELGYLIDWYVVEVPKDKKLNAPMIAMIAAQKEQVRLLQQARAAGFEMKVSLEAVVGFVSRSQTAALTKAGVPARPAREVQPRRSLEVTTNDRRFLRSLRIAADETTEPVE